MAQGLGMGVFFQKRKTRWTMLGGSNNVGRAEGFPVVPTESSASNRLRRLAARLATPFCMRFPKRSSLLKKDPHAQTSLNRMFHRAKVLRPFAGITWNVAIL